MAFNELSVGQEGAILVDMGVATISLFTVLMAIVMGVTLVYNELEQRTIFTVLSKPWRAGSFCSANSWG